MSEKLSEKLKSLPMSPGVYLYKDGNGKIIYVGKAARLRSRVRQYFQTSRARDTKTDLLVADIRDIDHLVVGSEIEALFLESELIKRYKPKYNIELRDDKFYEYVRVDIKSNHPTVGLVRRPMDDGAEYIGPFVQGIRPALQYLRRIFPYDNSQSTNVMRSSLMTDIGLSPGLEEGRTTLEDYRKNLRRLIRYLNGEQGPLLKQLEKDMKTAAKKQEFEVAARLRNQIDSLKRLKSQVIFGDKEMFDISKDQALDGLRKLLKIQGKLRRIEGYDISHMSGTNNVASMVVFTDGISDKGEYRKFKMRSPGNDDFTHMREVITRRFSGKNLEQWAKPDLILIDGGKGQVSSALSAMHERGVNIPMIGLAKRFEQIVIPTPALKGRTLESKEEVSETDGTPKGAFKGPSFESIDFQAVDLPHDSAIIKLLQRVRDESHRFAVSYHSTLKIKSQSKSTLDDIAGVGPKTRSRLIKAFGSLRGLRAASDQEIIAVLGAKNGEKFLAQWRSIR